MSLKSTGIRPVLPLALTLVAGLSTGINQCGSCTDSDGDGVCDDQDLCPGRDDSIDQDGDGIPDACEGFVVARDGQFYLDDLPFRYVGTNNYYLMTYAADQSLRPAVDEVLEEAAAMDMRVVRTWAFNDGATWNALQTEPGVYDERVFQGLDYVLARAAELDLRLILPAVNNWSDYGGMDQYVAWSPTAQVHDDFYTDENTRAYYQNHLSTLVSRVNTVNGRLYRDDPTIFAWELANEPRCSSDPSGTVVTDWVEEMSAFLKDIDPNHMVTTGVEGFYNDLTGPWYMNGFTGTDFIDVHSVAGIDFATAHSWPDTWGLTEEETMNLVDQQLLDARDVLGKPFILEEFGKPRDADLSVRNAWYSEWMQHVYDLSGDGAHYWIAYHDEYPDYDGYGVYYPADSSTISVLESYAALMSGE